MDVYQALFSMVLNMSMTGGIVIVLVMLVRLLLRCVPRKYSYLLWAVVLLRLLCPFTFSSVFSIFQVMHAPVSEQGRIEYVHQNNVWMEMQEEELAAVMVYDASVTEGHTVVPSADNKGDSAQRTWNLQDIAGIVWMAGTAALWIYSFGSVIRLRRQLTGAVWKEKNIYLCDYIETAFVLGVFGPKIYLPTRLAGTEREYILLHEQTHIRRGDHIFRLLAFFALSIHWFNPLVWCAFRLSERDMEMSCDEAVMGKMGTGLRTAYSASLLNIASGRQVFGGAPLGFGEGNVKCRIKNIMRYRKTAAWIAVPALAVVALLFVVLGSNPARSDTQEVKQTDGRLADSQQRKGRLLDLINRDEDSIFDEDSNFDEEGISDRKQIPIKRPVITDETIYGTDPAELDYADEKIVIFHGSFGLFVYDRMKSEFMGAVDLAAIGCSDTQGDGYCDVRVSKDGQKVYLHPLNIEDMYVYDVPGHVLIRTKYDVKGVEMFDGLKLTRECVEPQFIWGESSALCVQDDHGRYMYLEFRGSAKVNDLYLVMRENGEEKGYSKLFYNYNKKENSQRIFGYRGYNGYLDECVGWSGYEEFVSQDYDGDNLADRIYREEETGSVRCRYRIEFGNSDVIQTEWMGSGMPVVETCDLNGDGGKEILLQLLYGDSTDPYAFGETALFEKKSGSYTQVMFPKELYQDPGNGSIGGTEGLSIYTPRIIVSYERLDDSSVRVLVQGGKDRGIDQEVSLNDNLIWAFDQASAEMEHCFVSYKTVVVKGREKDYLDFHFGVFWKWSSDEIVVTAVYENGGLHVTDWRYVSDAGAVDPLKSEETKVSFDVGYDDYEYYLTKEELIKDIEQGYIFRLDTTFGKPDTANVSQGNVYRAPYVEQGNWPFNVYEENIVNLEIEFSDLLTKPNKNIFPGEEQIIVEVISPEGQSVYLFEKMGDEITKDTFIQEQISVMPGEWTLKISFAYVCGETPAHLKIAAAYETPSEEDIIWLKEERIRSGVKKIS